MDFEDAVGWMSDELDMLNPMKQQRLDENENENEDDNLLLQDILSDTLQAKVTFFGLRLKCTEAIYADIEHDFWVDADRKGNDNHGEGLD